ncbi:hypothetical protein GCM10009551_090630 [Nocardiopsis tropica]
MSNILVVTTSVPSYRVSGRRTGLWLGELTHFVDAVEAAGHTTTIASIDGGFVPIDPESLSHEVLAQGGTRARYDDPEFMARIANTVSLKDVDAADFDAIYLTGGHGVMFDFPTDERLAALLREFDAAGKIVSAVCHARPACSAPRRPTVPRSSRAGASRASPGTRRCSRGSTPSSRSTSRSGSRSAAPPTWRPTRPGLRSR